MRRSSSGTAIFPTVSTVAAEEPEAKLDLTLALTEAGNGFRGELELGYGNNENDLIRRNDIFLARTVGVGVLTATALVLIPIAVSVAAESDISVTALLMCINVAAAAALLMVCFFFNALRSAYSCLSS